LTTFDYSKKPRAGKRKGRGVSDQVKRRKRKEENPLPLNTEEKMGREGKVKGKKKGEGNDPRQTPPL